MAAKLNSIRVNNFRSLSMSENIEILPITILIGKNSAGKSTFARSFPLLRQSCEAKKRAPILWFGDRVDFGSFDNCLRHGAKRDGQIEFSFDISISDNRQNIAALGLRADELPAQKYEASILLRIRSGRLNQSLAANVLIQSLGYEVSVVLTDTNDVSSIKCGRVVWNPGVTDYTDAVYGAVLPQLTFMREASHPGGRRYTEFFPFQEIINKKISDGGFGAAQEAISNLIFAAPIMMKGTLGTYIARRIELRERVSPQVIAPEKLANFVTSLEDMIMIAKVNNLLEVADNALKDYYSGVKYIEPLRATAQRYYRKQELAIDEVDSKGQNMAMFLDNLSPFLKGEFNEWTSDHFGFSARTVNDGGHVAIVIDEASSEASSNLADIGFGFSQILPIITQIWASSRRTLKAKKTTSIVIEQPELHLHPSFQAKLADVFVASISKEMENPPSLIIETHSNHIVNRLGQLISMGKLNSRDVQILIFEKNDQFESIVTKSGFDNEGYLVNWPHGFFEPEV